MSDSESEIEELCQSDKEYSPFGAKRLGAGRSPVEEETVVQPVIQSKIEEIKESSSDDLEYCTPALEKLMLKNLRPKRFKWNKKPHVDNSNVFYMCEI